MRGRSPHADQQGGGDCQVSDTYLARQMLAVAGERLRASRLARGLTQQRLADAAGVSRSAVAQWETGRMSYGGRLGAIATALTMSSHELGPSDQPDDRSATPDDAWTSDEEDVLIRCYRSLDRTDQGCFLRLVRRLTLCEAA